MRVEASVVVEQPVERVFAFISDIERQPEWVGPVQAVKDLVPGPVEVGTTFTLSLAFMGQSGDVQQVVTTLDPNRTYAQKSASGPVPAEITFTVEPTEGGTLVRTVTEADDSSIPRLARGLVTRNINNQVKNDLQKLRALLE